MSASLPKNMILVNLVTYGRFIKSYLTDSESPCLIYKNLLRKHKFIKMHDVLARCLVC